MRLQLLSVCLLVSACAGGQEHGAASDAQPGRGASVEGASGPLSYYRDAKPILDTKCTQCHVEGGMGHFSLATYGEVAQLTGAVRSAVEGGRMPPWRAAGPHGQYEGDRRLTDAQKATLLAWIAQGAPEGDPADEPPHAVEPRGLNRIDATLTMPEPYTPRVEPDDYRCFVLDWNADRTKFITGLGIEPSNAELVHHGIVYLVQPENVARVRELDAADPGPGYECLGVGNAAWLTSYEPGGYGQDNPAGVGFEVRPGSALILQMHYNTLRHKGADQAKVQLKLEESVERVGRVGLIMNPLWPAGRMNIPAGQSDVVKRWQGRPYELARDKTYDLYWADLHMHTLGTKARLGVVRASGERQTLLDIPAWAFEWQETYRFVEPVRLFPGDQLEVECHFDNTEAMQSVINGVRLPVRDVNWGESTLDEMCLGDVLYVRAPEPLAPPVPPETPAEDDDPAPEPSAEPTATATP